MKAIIAGALLAFMGALAGCTSVKIQTGPPTDEEYTQQSEVQAKQLKSDWYQRLNGATPLDQLRLIRTFVDTTAARYLRFGENVADQWRQGNDSQPTPVPASDMRTAVDNTLKTDMPVIKAHEEILEYGVDEILRSGYFDPEIEKLLKQQRDLFYDVYSAVFYPSGTVDDYIFRMDETRRALEENSSRLEYEMTRY
jgi:hypothetical protein